MTEQFVLDGCTFTEGGFHGLSEEVLDSSLDAFFLTVPGQMEGFHECLIEIGKIYNLTDRIEKKLRIIKTYDDIITLKSDNKKGIILTFQEPHPVEKL